MVNQLLISFASSISDKIRKTLFILMIIIRKQENILCLSLGFLSSKVSSLQSRYINASRSSNCILLKNMSSKMEISIYVGADIFRWNFNKQTNNIEMQKAPICGRSLLYTHRCMMKECNSIIASYAINCNTLVRCYV